MASNTTSSRLILGAVLVLAAVALVARWRTLEHAADASERRAAGLEERTAALARAVSDLRGRPATERLIEREWRPAPQGANPTTPEAAQEHARGPGLEPQSPAEAKEAIRREKRAVFEKLEQKFKDEPVDPAWSRHAEQSLNQAIHTLPPGLGTIDSVVAKSQHSRIEATFDSAAEYNQFFKSLFLIEADVNDPHARPLFSEHGGIFAPYKEVASDGKFHAVIFVDRPHPPPGSERPPGDPG